jgi:hypothetical protein
MWKFRRLAIVLSAYCTGAFVLGTRECHPLHLADVSRSYEDAAQYFDSATIRPMVKAVPVCSIG